MKEKTALWLEFARRDIAAAERLAADAFLSNIVAYHAQQCVEKCLKALYEEKERAEPTSWMRNLRAMESERR